MNSDKGVLLPWIHEHLMVPWNDMRKGDCCGRYEANIDGYYCGKCDFFTHKKCGDESSEYIQHPSHLEHTLQFRSQPDFCCELCGRGNLDRSYGCSICLFYVDPHCAKYPPPKVIEVSETHHHKLTLLEELIEFECDAKCGKIGSGFPYECDECNITFHVDCAWNQLEVERPLEVNHPYHSLHPLKLLLGQPPEYSDRKCRLCDKKIDNFYYHCSSCNFTLDMRCVLHPPPKSLLDLKVHDHQLTLLPRLDSFTCNACGLKGDRSPYVCFQCGFMIHQDCLGLPRVININRHDHRISRTSVLGVVQSICGVCRKKVDWTYGGYSCQKCPEYVVHSKCATREDVWNGKELEGISEEIEDIEPFVVIDENTINHFSHREHNLKRDVNGVQYEESKRCRACCHLIGLQPFYGCIDCDFVIHQNCGQLPQKKWHPLHNDRLTLLTSEEDSIFCDACGRWFNGFSYQHEGRQIDARFISISEPFVHPSHSHHPLYYILADEGRPCNGCKKTEPHVLRCIEVGCEFVVCFKCATLPQVMKHRVDNHPPTLCYGEEEASGKYWCDICEKETNPKKWFYTCKDHRGTMHTKCVLGDFSGLMPRSKIENWGKSYEVVLNDSISRPYCTFCESHSMYPIFLLQLGISDRYCCDRKCNSRFS